MPEAASEAALAVEGVGHRYDSEPVLSDVDLTVRRGDAVALLGPSGCGKTTLLRIIAGLERPAEGSVRLGNALVAAADTFVPPERRRVGMVFQDWALFPHMSVAKNVAYGLPSSERSGPRVGDALELVGLNDFAERAPATLSGGQQQRVALARALAPRPDVLLLDEPFSSLDTALRVEVRTEVHRLLAELEITTIFVTHDQEEAFVVGDEVAVMNAGKVVQVGTPAELYRRPADRWVAEFVGTVSPVRGMASGGDAATAIGPIRLHEPLTGDVDVFLRPEQLVLGVGEAGLVELVEFYGHDNMVFVRVGDSLLKVRTGPESEYRRGDRVAVKFVGRSAAAFALPGRS
jgi:iron(III) transport system ATP-binding protein